MTKIKKGPDPLPGPTFTDFDWKATGVEHDVLWVGSGRVLFWHRPSGEFSVYEYDPTKPANADPFKGTPTSEGSWGKRGLVEGHRLLWLGGRRLLDWQPTGPSSSRVRLWNFDPTRPGDPIAGDPLTETEWKSIGTENRLVYLGQDWVLDQHLEAGKASTYNVYRCDRAATKGKDPVPSPLLTNGRWSTIGREHWLDYLGGDRVLVWDPTTGHYRVYRLDRKATGWSQILPDPVLAEGEWESFRPMDRLIFLGEPLSPSTLRRAIRWRPTTKHIDVWGCAREIPEVPEDTDVPGVQLKRVGEAAVLVVDAQRLSGGNAPLTVAGLAARVRLSPAQVFQELLGFPDNEHAVQALHAAQLPGKKYPGRGPAVAALKSAGNRFTAEGGGKYIYTTATPYEGWGVTTTKPVVLSLSPAFREVLKDATAARVRQQRIDALQPTFTALLAKVDALKVALVRLELTTDYLRKRITPATQDLALVQALHGLLQLILKGPKAALTADDRARIEKLAGLVKTLAAEHNQHAIVDPAFEQKGRQDRDAAATKVLQLVEDKDLVRQAGELASNLDIAPTDLQRHAYDTAQSAYALLLVSQLGESVLERHVQPFVTATGVALDPAVKLPGKKPAFEAELVTQAKVPGEDTLLSALAKFTGPIPQAVGNTPGPASLAVAAMQLAAPMLLNRFAGDVGKAHLWAGRLFKACARVGNFDVATVNKGVVAIEEGNLRDLRRLDWSGKFQASPAWASAIGVINAVAFLAACEANDANTIRQWSNMIGAYTGTSAAGIQLGQALARSLTLGRLGVGLNFAGRALGTVGGVAACLSGAITAMEEHDSGDRVGMWLAIAGSAAGAMSAAGFLLAGGLALTATGGGAPVGVILMAVGCVVGLGSAAVGLIRDKYTAGTHTVFEVLLGAYGRGGADAGTYAWSADKVKSLEAAFEAVKTEHQPGWFSGYLTHVTPDAFPGEKVTGVELLHDLGLSPAAIAKCVELEETDVRARLAKAGRTVL